MVAALIKYTQGVNVGSAGVALSGTTIGGSVVCSNGNDAGVLSWLWETLYVPPGSSVGNLSVTTATYTFGPPDVPGSYRIRLTVTGSGGVTDVDIRNFVVPFPHGAIVPPYQANPSPLPLTGTGAKPDEMNVGGQNFGWAGDLNTSRKLFHQLVQRVDNTIPPRAVKTGLVLDLRPEVGMLSTDSNAHIQDWYDQAGLNHCSTHGASPPPTVQIAAKIPRRAIEFNGSTQLLVIPTTASLNPGVGSWVCMAFVLFRASAGVLQQVIGKSNNSDANNWRCMRNASKHLQVFWGSDAQNYPASSFVVADEHPMLLIWGVDAANNKVIYGAACNTTFVNYLETQTITVSGSGTGVDDVYIAQDNLGAKPTTMVLSEVLFFTGQTAVDHLTKHANLSSSDLAIDGVSLFSQFIDAYGLLGPSYPSVGITSPTSGYVGTIGSVTVTGTVGADVATTISSVVVQFNGVTLGTATVTTGAWSYLWSPSSSQNGTANLQAIATDAVGGVTYSTAYPIAVVDILSQSIDSGSPTYSQTGPSVTLGFPNGAAASQYVYDSYLAASASCTIQVAMLNDYASTRGSGFYSQLFGIWASNSLYLVLERVTGGSPGYRILSNGSIVVSPSAFPANVPLQAVISGGIVTFSYYNSGTSAWITIGSYTAPGSLSTYRPCVGGYAPGTEVQSFTFTGLTLH